MDVDLVADLEEQHVQQFIQRLSNAYYASEAAIRDAIARRSCFNLIHLETNYKIDIFINQKRTFDSSAFSRATKVELTAHEPITIPMASREDIILAKLVWYREGGETSERQLNDVRGLINVARTTADVLYLTEQAKSLKVEDLLKRMLD